MRATLAQRLAGVRPALWPILQTAIAGTVAWELARLVPGHDRPLFAPIVAIVAMGISAGRRARLAVRLVLGATLGIAVADVLVRLLGEGPVQLGLVLFVALALARTLSAEPAFVTQAGISALLVFAVEREAQGLAPERLLDALIGGAVALVMALLLFPIDPLAAVRRASREVFAELERALRDTAAALRDGDVDRAAAARARRYDAGRLDDAVRLGLDAARIAPRRRRAYRQVASYADVALRLGGIARGTRVVAGSAARVLRARGAPAPELSDPVARLADALAALAQWLDAGDPAQRERARELALAAARRAAGTPTHELGGGTIVHLVQSQAVDLLRLTGLDGADVQQQLARALAEVPPEARLHV
jgi:uncharacterized membrane protein YccC